MTTSTGEISLTVDKPFGIQVIQGFYGLQHIPICYTDHCHWRGGRHMFPARAEEEWNDHQASRHLKHPKRDAWSLLLKYIAR